MLSPQMFNDKKRDELVNALLRSDDHKGGAKKYDISFDVMNKWIEKQPERFGIWTKIKGVEKWRMISK